MNLEVTEKEAERILWERYAEKHHRKRDNYILLSGLVIPFVLFIYKDVWALLLTLLLLIWVVTTGWKFRKQARQYIQAERERLKG
jgi:Ca2+/Na+ antiporter